MFTFLLIVATAIFFLLIGMLSGTLDAIFPKRIARRNERYKRTCQDLRDLFD